MAGLGAVFLVFIIIYCCITWLLPKILAWLFKRRFHVDVQIGRIAIPYFQLQDVQIKKNGYSVHIDEIGFRSSFFSSEVTKLVAVIIRDVRINKDVGDGDVGDHSRLENYKSFSSQPSRDWTQSDHASLKVPPVVITFAQFTAVHISNVSAMLLHQQSPEWLVHATAAELHLDSSVIHNARSLFVNATLVQASAKVLRHAADGHNQTCLAELSLGLSFEAMMSLQGPFSVDKLHMTVEEGKAVINEGLYNFAADRQRSNVYESSHVPPTRPNTLEVTKRSAPENPIAYMAVVLHKLAPLIPKDLSLRLDDSQLTSMRASSATEFRASLDCFQVHTSFSPSVNADKNELPDLSLSLLLKDLGVRDERERVLVLQKLTFNSKLQRGALNVDLQLHTLAATYNHRAVYSWFSTNFLRTSPTHPHPPHSHLISRNKISDLPNGTSNISRHKGVQEWLRHLFKAVRVSCYLEFRKVSAQLRLGGSGSVQDASNSASVACNHIRVKVNHNEVQKTPPSKKADAWNAELVVDVLWMRLNEINDKEELNVYERRRSHAWGTPLFLGMALIDIRPRKLESTLDMLFIEWSPQLAAFLTCFNRCYHSYKDRLPHSPSGGESTWAYLDWIKSSFITSSLTNVNVFLISEPQVGIMMRVDSTAFNSLTVNGKNKTTIDIDGAKLVSLTSCDEPFICVRSDDVKTSTAHVRHAALLFTAGELEVQLVREVHMDWSANLHLRLLALTQDFADFREQLRSDNNAFASSKPTEKVSLWGFVKQVSVLAPGRLSFGITLSSKHTMLICTDNLSVAFGIPARSISAAKATIAIDNHNTFFIEGLSFKRLLDCAEVRTERQHAEGFTLDWNDTWCTTIESLKAIFPYEHDFADAVKNEAMSIAKWLKIVHRRKKAAFTADSPLPCDLVIKINEFLMEMSDDPFEVKLRDNFELLEDEYKESLKRSKMLEAKVQQLCKEHLLLPSGKVEELYTALTKKNAEIYVQRSKQMSKTAPARTRLFAWLMSGVEIMALADPSMHGADNVVRNMTEIDPDSPWPEEGLEFSTLWCRAVTMSCQEWQYQLRDFPQPLLDVRQMNIWGRLVGAEQVAPKRAKCGLTIELGAPWGQVTVDRGMTSLKFYHDLNCDVERYSYAFGPCWEPVIAQCNLSFTKINSPSRDPSPVLPFWDKMRLLFHGRLTMETRQLTILLHASLDPYNTTEEMELTWRDVVLDWTNAKVVLKGSLFVYVRTASKYDDCNLLHLPDLRLTLKLGWVCLADPNDHHAVMPCAPDKLPEYSSNQEHDSYRAFRSQNLNLTVSLETKQNLKGNNKPDPVIMLYGSTLRWFESLKLILSGVTRPTRRGALFNNARPRKIQLSRHYRKVHLSLVLHSFQVSYWMSSALQRGFQLSGGRVTCSSEHTLSIVPTDDGLKHRARAEWAIMYMNCEFSDAEIWLKSALQEEEDAGKEHLMVHPPVEKCYFLSVSQVSYGRDAALSLNKERSPDTPTHRLVVHNLKGAWTKRNRDVASALFDTFVKNQQLKKNLSTEALKGFRPEGSTTPLKVRNRPPDGQMTPTSTATIQPSAVQATPSPMTKLQSGHTANMLKQLIAEADKKSVVYSDDTTSQTRDQSLQGLSACQEDDVLHKNWLIALVNSQVLLKGCDSKGYVIISAAKTEVLQRVHRPVWKDQTLVSKTTWLVSLECMQYYATVSAGRNDTIDENIMWLTVSNIQEKDSAVISDLPDIPDMVGSGQSVGGVVSETVGASSAAENFPLQLQRIVSRCNCEFFYVGYGESSVDPSTLGDAPPPPVPIDEAGPWEKREPAVDAFTLMHHDLDVCTNSLQYAMLLDVVNNLLLYVEPRRKEALERLQRMRFQFQLLSRTQEDERRPIQQLQNYVRSLVSKLRRLERETYLVRRALNEDPDNPELLSEMVDLETLVYECKEQLTGQSEELDMMLSCYKERQLSAHQKVAISRGDKPITTVRASEISFKHAKWRLTETDGLLGIADLKLSNFLYTKHSKSDDSVEHLLELGHVEMINLLPNQMYDNVLSPTEIERKMPVDRKRAVRIFCREKAPVGGISVKEHFEINVVPITIGLTKTFYDKMLKFCFPEREQYPVVDSSADDDISEADSDRGSIRGSTISSQSSGIRRTKESSFYVPIEHKDDVEKMKERAEKNKLFIYIKIPEVPVRLSYKGNKKNLKDIRDFSLVIPTLEYHNVTWTWLDLLLAMKNDSRRVILSQAIKHKLKINRRSADDCTSPQEEDKARLLFGSKLMPGETKPSKKGVFKFPK